MKETKNYEEMMMDDMFVEELAVDVTAIEDIIALNKLLNIDSTELELDVLEQQRSEF